MDITIISRDILRIQFEAIPVIITTIYQVTTFFILDDDGLSVISRACHRDADHFGVAVSKQTDRVENDTV